MVAAPDHSAPPFFVPGPGGHLARRISFSFVTFLLTLFVTSDDFGTFTGAAHLEIIMHL